MITAEVPTGDISGLLDIANKSLYVEQMQLALLCIVLGVLIVLVMIGGREN